jgi:hypothetical protein
MIFTRQLRKIARVAALGCSLPHGTLETSSRFNVADITFVPPMRLPNDRDAINPHVLLRRVSAGCLSGALSFEHPERISCKSDRPQQIGQCKRSPNERGWSVVRVNGLGRALGLEERASRPDAGRGRTVSDRLLRKFYRCLPFSLRDLKPGSISRGQRRQTDVR